MQSSAAESLTRSELELRAAAVLELRRRKLAESIYRTFYGWQHDFVASTKTHTESCLCAANQVGKTRTGTTIDAFHLLGEYPDDWPGHRFESPPHCWGLGYSMEKTRDLLQEKLFGKFTPGMQNAVGKGFNGGLIPKERIVGYESATGTPNAARTVSVEHAKGISTIQFWSYSQGQHAIMGDVVDWFHIDEEPRDQSIRPQVLTRTINGDSGKGGRGIYTFTPENGRTELVIQFMDNPSKDQFFMQKGWSDAPHITSEKAERLLGQYPAHQRDMRTKGVPMLGHGRIYDLSEDFLLCDPFEIPDHWFVINGMDFGWDHPQAHIQLAHDRDNDIFYVTRAFKASKISANDAWGSVQSWAKNIPTAWPHDGLQNEKGRDDAVQQKVHYERAGFRMIPDHATWQEGGNSVESGLYLLNDLMRKGKLKIFKGLVDLIDEVRQYHRNESGKIVKVRDDLLDALRYAMMMTRFAVRYGDIGEKESVYIPRPMRVMGRK